MLSETHTKRTRKYAIILVLKSLIKYWFGVWLLVTLSLQVGHGGGRGRTPSRGGVDLGRP